MLPINGIPYVVQITLDNGSVPLPSQLNFISVRTINRIHEYHFQGCFQFILLRAIRATFATGGNYWEYHVGGKIYWDPSTTNNIYFKVFTLPGIFIFQKTIT